MKGVKVDEESSRKGWDGTVKGVKVDEDGGTAENRMGQNNNTVRSNRGGFRSHIDADLDGDGAMETSLNMFNDQVCI